MVKVDRCLYMSERKNNTIVRVMDVVRHDLRYISRSVTSLCAYKPDVKVIMLFLTIQTKAKTPRIGKVVESRKGYLRLLQVPLHLPFNPTLSAKVPPVSLSQSSLCTGLPHTLPDIVQGEFAELKALDQIGSLH